MNYKNITVAGSGVLGSQIAYQTAFHGFQVSVYDINDEALELAKERIKKLKPRYQEDLKATQEEVDAAYDRLSFYSDLAEAVKDADLVIEAVPERVEIKVDFYKKLAAVAPDKTVFVTNSSTLLPSQFAEATGRPEKFLALHFANEIWKNNTAEVMKHPGTDMQYFDQIIEFAKAIGMVALPLYKEQPGYILNSLLVPFLEAAQMLLVKEVSDPETIDKTWMIATGAPLGPFAILDVVGIRTAYNITLAKAEATGNEEFMKLAELLKREYIDKGKLGRETGEGFYKYPNPSFAQPGFLKG
ncbi:3-hydroxyacyl-CoA dehydrogenase [Caldifermentibacillus hisashii]|jgi:3-hydroxybutyryl-CoA dehydrogenase|uniref:3-hydroxybutyryl-CoA dehydrogenase n=2 Tax=Bacillaceae TaxID=186817 RepID=A0A0D0EV13_9BACI|nr:MULTISPECIES: 3-hydroxyacyl-CoA dehydrogenase [Bacillaceae]MCB5936455.1 3-hydroxyacyl-CoA dehydrogenase [Bacillus sp. DFI.2.34]AWI11095.1 3-hydroxybutyryl-CoA dehydrogenase [Caldibacillus thermoamylovorans]KIO64287.1 3-hydroxybutyryl-CoA dehydrogenase [Caldibacillus thermoamylovorans]KIO64838.1 3-hydroxybutyryl-CoA dehydrogenase [Caldibacillus thermoamylovorans]KIO72993.1 3-hydroxybutyryl-CoA dehydrogenase [Caldibacillus thermoamylovorans]